MIALDCSFGLVKQIMFFVMKDLSMMNVLIVKIFCLAHQKAIGVCIELAKLSR